MFGPKKTNDKLIISCDHRHIRYLVMSYDDHGAYISSYDTADLPEGIIKDGEVLRVEAFAGMLNTMYQNVKKNVSKVHDMEVTLLLHHDLFEMHELELENYTAKKSLERQLRDQFKTKHVPGMKESSYCHAHYYPSSEHLALYTLEAKIYDAYYHPLVNLGFKKVTILSDLSIPSLLLNEQEHALLVLLGEERSRIIEYKNGSYQSDKKFQLSYLQLVDDIAKNLSVSQDYARSIINEYGVSRAHKDQKVYARLIRTLTPLLDYLRQRKVSDNIPVKVLYLNIPLLGFNDLLEKRLSRSITALDPFESQKQTFHDVQILPKSQSYQYALLVTASLRTSQSHLDASFVLE